ncbi:DUF4239 domain-containing protein [Streptomyces sp. NBC_00075]|uniref:bestrophin-like domain n=1 Tax=Streptomyces sp. NBC_00075 TaxID=2975641 RepID=UPI003243D011
MPILGIVLLLSGSAMATAAVFVVARLVPVARRKVHNDVLGFVYAEIGVIYAVVLAMVVVGVWETRSQAHENTYTETNTLLQLTWYSSSLPQPDRTRLGTLVERYTGTVIDDEWPLLAEQRDDPAAWQQFTEIRSLVNTQEPETGADQVRALEAVAQLGDGPPRARQRGGDGGRTRPAVDGSAPRRPGHRRVRPPLRRGEPARPRGRGLLTDVRRGRDAADRLFNYPFSGPFLRTERE